MKQISKSKHFIFFIIFSIFTFVSCSNDSSSNGSPDPTPTPTATPTPTNESLPGAFTVTSIASTNASQGITLTWPNSAGATSYKISRGTESGSYPIEVSVNATSPFVDADAKLNNGTRYFYKVVAVNSAGETPASDEISAMPLVSMEAFLKASNVDPDSYSWSMSASGDTVAIGAFRESSNQVTITNGTSSSSDNSAGTAGAVYVYRRSGTIWVQEAYIKASNAENLDYFGVSVSLDQDTLVVGAYGEDSNQTSITNGSGSSSNNSNSFSGAAYVYKLTGVVWAQEAYLKSSYSEASDFYGSAVAIHGDTIAVAASAEGSNQSSITNGATASSDNSLSSAGAVYIYKRAADVWSQEAYIKPSNMDSSDQFGSSMSLYEDTLVVGARGEDSGQNTISHGTTSSSDNLSSSAGAAYVFKRTGNLWAQEAYLKASNADIGDQFGISVALYDDTIAVGAAYEDSNQSILSHGGTASTNNSMSESGAVYIFTRSSNLWSEQAYLKASNVGVNDYFGQSIGIYDNTLIVGAPRESSNQSILSSGTTASSDDSSVNSGAAYVFHRVSNQWEQEAYLKAPNVDSDDKFGQSVCIAEHTLFVGAPQEDSNQSTITNGSSASSDNSLLDSGASYVFLR